MLIVKKIYSLLFLTVCFFTFVLPVSAEEHPLQKEYDDAVKLISTIDFEYYTNSSTLGDDVKNDLERIQEYVSTHEQYTIEDLNAIIEPADTNQKSKSLSDYDYTKFLPTSKDVLNAEEKEIFNSNPAYGLSVLLQASYANDQEASRFGSNTWATNGDAFRHALWNALGTHYTSEAYMESFATAHETGSLHYNADSIDTKMDLQNNAAGRSLVQDMKLPVNPPNAMVIPYLISNNIAAATENGELVRFFANGVQYDVLISTDSATKN